MAQFSYGTAIADRLWVGANAKYIQESYTRRSASAAAGDVGILYHPTPKYGLPDSSIGLSPETSELS